MVWHEILCVIKIKLHILIIPICIFCISRYLDFMFDGYNGPIRPQDFRVIYQTLASTPEGITALIEFLTNKLDRIVNQIIDGNKVAVSIYSILASRVAHNDEISKVCVQYI